MEGCEGLSNIAGVGCFVDKVGSKRRDPALTDASASHCDDGDILKDEVEKRLEKILFGKQSFQPVKGSASGVRSLDSESETEECGNDARQAGLSDTSGLDGQPAWHDEDDAKISVDITAHMRTRKLRKTVDERAISGTSYNKRLRSQYEKILGRPQWAIRPSKSKRKQRDPSESSDSSDDEMLQRTGDLLRPSTDTLPSGFLDLKRMEDANSSKRAQAVVRAVEFHPSANVVLVAGYHKTLDLFQVDGQVNPKLQSIHIERFPICVAHFSQDGKEVILAGRRKMFYVYDMMAGKISPIHGIRGWLVMLTLSMTHLLNLGRDERYYDKFVVSPDNQYLVFLGKDGYLLLVSNKSKQWIGELKMNGNVYGVTFTSDARYMLSTGSEGKVYVWDMSSRECVHCFVDEGCIVGTRISISTDCQYLACGSESGVVNLYDGRRCLYGDSGSNPKPVKAVMNLTTGIDSMCINSTSELMVIASQRKKDALRVVHLPSQTVFSNWPAKKTPLGYVTSLDISPHNKYLAVGNARGRVLLYRFNHYYQN